MVISFEKGKYLISVFNSIDSIAARWDSVSRQNLRTDYLSILERSNPSDMEFLYIIIDTNIDGKKVTAGILYFQRLKFTKKNIDLKNFFLNIISSILLFLRPIKLLVSGNLFAVSSPALCFDETLISLREVLEIMIMINKQFKNDAFILKDLEKLPENLVNEYGLKAYSNDMTMSMQMDESWLTLEDYLIALTKKYKKRAEKIIESGKMITRKELNYSEIESSSSQINELFNQIVSKQTVRMGLIQVNYFSEFKKNFDDTFTFIAYYQKEKLIAFSTYIDHGETLEHHYIGIDYVYNQEYSLYFNILFDGLKMAISKRKKFLELGRTAREAKANMGGFPVYFNDYMLIRKGLPLLLSKSYDRFFQREMGENWKNRKPFGTIVNHS